MSRDTFYPNNSEDQSNSEERALPPLHEVLGDVLERSARPPAARRTSYDDPRSSAHHSMSSGRGPDLAPLVQGPVYRSRSDVHLSAPRDRSSTSQPPAGSSAQSRMSEPSFHLFNYTPNRGLIHQRSSTQDDLDLSTPRPRLPPSDPARKHVCAECGKRFSKQSTLRNHLLTHTGDKPFGCEYPGCGRRFSMACNMQRHMRTHASGSAFRIEPVDDGDYPTPSRSPTTQPSSRGGSSRGGSSREGSSQGGSPRDDIYTYTETSRYAAKH